MEKENNISILELTQSKIKQEKNDILQRLQLDRTKLKLFHKKLKQYRYIQSIQDIVVGNYIRWINVSNPENIRLTNGAIVTDFKEAEETTYLVYKCLLFQKLNLQEETLLAVINYLEKK